MADTVVTYTLAVNNTGNRICTNLHLTDPLPAGVTYGGGGSFAGGLVIWTLPRLVPGGEAARWFTGTLSCTAGSQIKNQNYIVSEICYN